jgi:hypothetical protein
VYAAGLLAVEVLSGRSVQELMRMDSFAGGGPEALLSHVVSRGGHVSEARIRATIPKEYADALVRATKNNRAERFADGQAFYESFALNAPLRR